MPPEVKVYDRDADGNLVSEDGPVTSKDGFPLHWKEPRGRSMVELKADFLACLREQKGRMTHAAEALGVPYGTVTSWMSRDDGFRDNVDSVREAVRDDIRKLADDKAHEALDPEFIKLKMRQLPEYNQARETKLNVTGNVQHSHAVGLIGSMSPGDRKQLLLDAADAVDVEYEEVKEAD